MSKEADNKVEVVIGAETYVVRGEDPPEYMQMLASDLNSRISRVREMNPRLGTLRSAILTSLNLLDELIKLKKEHQTLVDLLEETGERGKNK